MIVNGNMNVVWRFGFLKVTPQLPNPFAEAIIYKICIQNNLYFQLNSLFCMLYQIGQNYFTGALNKLLNCILHLLDFLLAVIFCTAPEAFDFCNFLIPNSGVAVNWEADAVNTDSGKRTQKNKLFFQVLGHQFEIQSFNSFKYWLLPIPAVNGRRCNITFSTPKTLSPMTIFDLMIKLWQSIFCPLTTFRAVHISWSRCSSWNDLLDIYKILIHLKQLRTVSPLQLHGLASTAVQSQWSTLLRDMTR